MVPSKRRRDRRRRSPEAALHLHKTSLHIAVAVAEVAYKRGLAAVPRPNDMMAFIESQMYDPHY
jgi:hypothetical protein